VLVSATATLCRGKDSPSAWLAGRRPLPVVLLLWAATALMLWLAAATGLDHRVLRWLAWPDQPPRSDLLLLLRVWGSLWTWTLIALASTLLTSSTPGSLGGAVRSRGLPLLLIPTVAGGLAELLKLLTRRERPSELEIYLFRAWTEQPLSTRGLGLPSSHSAVAFAGSVVLLLHCPRLAWPALAVAAGCGFTRIASGAHYPSDVLAGAAVGVVTALLLSPHRPNPRRRLAVRPGGRLRRPAGEN